MTDNTTIDLDTEAGRTTGSLASDTAPRAAVAAATAGPVPPPEAPVPSSLGPAAAAAFSAGWMIALLYGRVPQLAAEAKPLPTINELNRADRAGLILGQLRALLSGPLATAMAPPAEAPQVRISVMELEPVGDLAAPTAFRDRIEPFHVKLLTQLTVYDRRLGEAYSLGRSLSDTCWQQHGTQADLTRMFGKYRLANLQGWLADLAPSLPECSAFAVSQGLDHWVAWLSANPGLDWDTHRPAIELALNAQGEQWRALLACEKNPKSLLTPEGFVAAGEAALSRASRIVRRAAVHFWLPILIVGLLTMLGVAIALRYTAGATKLLGAAISLAAGLGVTGKSLQATAKQLAQQASQPLLNLAESDAIGWAATCLPAVAASPSQQRRLLRLGVNPPKPDLVDKYPPEQLSGPRPDGAPPAPGTA